MTLHRDGVPARVATLLGRPVRWGRPVGDFDGRERTLEVYDAPGKEQRVLMRRLQPHWRELEAAADGAIVVVFYTAAESMNLRATLLRPFPIPGGPGEVLPTGTSVRVVDIVQRDPATFFVGAGDRTFDVSASELEVAEPDDAERSEMERVNHLSLPPEVSVAIDALVSDRGSKLPRVA